MHPKECTINSLVAEERKTAGTGLILVSVDDPGCGIIIGRMLTAAVLQ